MNWLIRRLLRPYRTRLTRELMLLHAKAVGERGWDGIPADIVGEIRGLKFALDVLEDDFY